MGTWPAAPQARCSDSRATHRIVTWTLVAELSSSPTSLSCFLQAWAFRSLSFSLLLTREERAWGWAVTRVREASLQGSAVTSAQ